MVEAALKAKLCDAVAIAGVEQSVGTYRGRIRV